MENIICVNVNEMNQDSFKLIYTYNSVATNCQKLYQVLLNRNAGILKLNFCSFPNTQNSKITLFETF